MSVAKRGEPNVSFTLIDQAGTTLAGCDETQTYYAASTVKLAVAAAVMFAVEAGTLHLTDEFPVRLSFASRIPDAEPFGFEPAEQDPGLPEVGTMMSVDWYLERMITVSSNEATNILIEALGAGVAGINAVEAALDRLGVRNVEMSRLICDYPAALAGYTHSVTTRSLADLALAVVSSEELAPSSRAVILGYMRAQLFPMIAPALPAGAVWGAKSGWDEGIRHDVAVIGEPGTPEFRVLAVCTKAFYAAGAQEAIAAVTRAVL
ncbi:serine hydrolase [Leucobacter sp. cx-328]|uniref:serine hydrolase n=1 Tax=unclassified Leucobacter TaxID=2621730 RepID=UPI00165D36A0|nr:MULTISPECIES: serine hydrolase [unclassified Leucobacter]MBC9944110.1 serine hydrolase [Leucobacter sp. cx-328]